jgi:acetyl-CoA acetyltransferase
MKNALSDRPVAIIGAAELPRRRRSGLSAYELAAELYRSLLTQTGLAPSDIDGVAVTNALSETSNPFWSNMLVDALGLSPRWLQVTDLGGASAVANIARAAAAIMAGQCEIVLCLNADAASTRNVSDQGGYKREFAEPAGFFGPVSAFGLIACVYSERYGDPSHGLAQLAVAQRAGALRNPTALEELRAPMTPADYLASPIVAAPLRRLDCVMTCDGGNGCVVTSADRARSLGIATPVFPISYAERTNFAPHEALPDLTETGFSEIGPEVLAKAGMKPADLGAFHPYDDFLIAVALQLEQIGFCARGEASRFLGATSIRFDGEFPINPGGGQISGGQPGLAGGGGNLVEALRQMRGEATDRQVANRSTALVTGIGTIQYGRNWGTSNALVLSL